jgi:nucleotide-binding universal stress UspA family protein
MYKHILIATDGSEVANRAISHGVGLAKEFGSKLTAVIVTEPYEALLEIEAPIMMNSSEYKERCAASAAKNVSVVTAAAETAGIEYDTLHLENRLPYEGIIEAAEKVGADLIVVGSHGRRGIAGLLLGSQAAKLLTHTKVPTLVVR